LPESFFCPNSEGDRKRNVGCLIDALAFRRYRPRLCSSMNPEDYDPITAALKEDIGEGDITTEFFVPGRLQAIGHIVSQEPAIVAGTAAAAEVFRKVDPATDVQIHQPDGASVVAGDIVLEVRGLARSILKAERVALNFLQRLCGIA